MQNAETVLGVLRERGRNGLPLDELYRQLFNPQLYLLAYGRIYSNDGAMTPGSRGNRGRHVLGKIGRIIEAVRHERYRFSPAGGPDPQEERETEAARHAHVVGQAARRSDPPDVGGVLRAAVR